MRARPPTSTCTWCVDNYATHKHPAVKAWLAQHPRFQLHFTPTSSSWLNLVERFFAEITRKRIRRGVFKSVTDLEVAIHSYLIEHNDHPRPFVWTKSADAILARDARPSPLSKLSKPGTKRQSSEHLTTVVKGDMHLVRPCPPPWVLLPLVDGDGTGTDGLADDG